VAVPAIGAKLGGYRLEQLVGRGAMGAVYRAEDLRLGRRVALKVLAAELADDERFRERFLTESRLAASLDHAGIVPIFEAGEADGLLYIAMRYVEGGDLRALVEREGRLAPERAVALVEQVAGALDAAHARGLVHRDVKPSNVLVAVESGREHAYLADFGLTKHTTSRGGPTASDQMVGTVDYVAPEQIRGDEVDGRADLYSLGCVLFECLTGEVPFTRRSEVATIYAHLEDDPPRASERCRDVPPALDAVIERALAKDPKRRWQSGAELAAALHDTRGRARVPRRAVLVALAAIAAVGATIGALSLRHRDEPGTLKTIDANSVAVIDPTRASLIAPIPVGASPSQVVTGANAVWVANVDDGTVSRLDPKTHTVRQTITVGGGPSAIAVGAGGVWVVNGLDGTLSWISPATNRVVKTIPVGNGPSGVCVADGAVWVANRDDRTLWRFEPHTGRRTERVALDTSPTQLACGRGAVWASSESSGTVTEVDAANARVVRSVDVGGGASGLALAAGGLWVANTLDGTVMQIDPARGVVVRTVPLGANAGPIAVAATPQGVWVANAFAGTLVRLDPSSGVIKRTLTVGSDPQGVAVVDGTLWVSARAASTAHRGGTIRVVTAEKLGPRDFDPAIAYYIPATSLLTDTNDGLVAFRHVGGSEGARIVPDLAISVPEPTDGGRTYTFQVRRGIEYSNGATVRASDIRRGLERAIRLERSHALPEWYSAIVAAPRCAARPKACDLSRGIVVDDTAGTITFHLTTPDPDFRLKLAMPNADAVPAGVPSGVSSHVVPATGPYVMVRRSGQPLHLARNPHFRVWSQAARPDGHPDAIAIGVLANLKAEIHAVEEAKADYVVDGLLRAPRADLETILTRYVGQIHSSTTPQVHYFFLNTRLAPFDRLDARRAIAYAVDRRAMVRNEGGRQLASRTCQFLPPNFPGYRPYCPYTSAPDLTKARRLVAHSHTAGTRVVVWTSSRAVFARDGRYLVRLLNDLGYRASLRKLPGAKYFTAVADSRNHAQIGPMGWAQDFPSPADFLALGKFQCAGAKLADAANINTSQFCDSETDRMTQRAQRAQELGQRSADALWAQVDRRVVDQAAVVPLVNARQLDFVSRRVANYQYNPPWGILLDQLWVR
jgi:YVTN family beta-propeller protein